MRTLFILRHAKSSWNDSQLADHDRPLNKRGTLAAQQVGRFMRCKGWLPDFVLASSARRAQETLALWSKSARFEGHTETHRDLYLAEPNAYLSHLKLLGASNPERVMCIGHNPGLEELLTVLTGKRERLPTAALAHIEIAIDEWSALGKNASARLVDLCLVKQLEDE